jgi:acetate---CoA ligase (ADP-forming)
MAAGLIDMDLAPLLRPRSVAVVGASGRAGSFGQRLLANLAGWHFAGAIYPVNAGYQSLQDRPCYADLAALPEVPDCVAFAVSDDRIEQALINAAAAGVRAGMIFGRGYEPPVPGRPGLSERLSAIAREAGMAMCGNNAMGYICVAEGLRMSGNPPPVDAAAGCVGLISHSGSTWSGLVGNQRDLRFNYAVSAGGEIAVGLADYMQFLLSRPETRVIACVIETVRQPEQFLAALEEADRRGIPVVALKLGRSEAGRHFALAHSGALSGSDAVYGAVFARHNVIRVTSVDELTDTVELLSCPRRPTGSGVGMVTNSGGERQLVVDLAADVGCPMATIGAETTRRLEAVLDPGMSPVNPVDSFGDGRMLVGECMQALTGDPAVGVVVLLSNLVYGRATARNEGLAVEQVHHATEKPVLVVGNLHSAIDRPEATRLRGIGIPVLMGTTTSLLALRHFLAWHNRRPAAAAPPADEALARHWRGVLTTANGKPLSAEVSLTLFAAYGGAIAASAVVHDEAALTAAAGQMGFPLVLKTAAPEVLHKTEQRGVVLGIADRPALLAAYAQLTARFGPACLVQQQLPPGLEVLLGMVNDADFGPAMTIGLGGIFTEVFRDTVTVIPPVSFEDAHAHLRRLRAYPVLQGARGTAGANLDALARAIERFSLLCAAVGSAIREMDVNPLIAGPDGAVAVDALVLPVG